MHFAVLSSWLSCFMSSIRLSPGTRTNTCTWAHNDTEQSQRHKHWYRHTHTHTYRRPLFEDCKIPQTNLPSCLVLFWLHSAQRSKDNGDKFGQHVVENPHNNVDCNILMLMQVRLPLHRPNNNTLQHSLQRSSAEMKRAYTLWGNCTKSWACAQLGQLLRFSVVSKSSFFFPAPTGWP